MNRISPQYVAGFLDGEGNITILERNRYAGYSSYGLIIGFTNCDLRPLAAIKLSYGGSIFEKKRYSKKHSRSFELRIAARSAVTKLLTDILPYLICKREQAELGLVFQSLGHVKKQVIEHRRIHATKGGTYPISKALPGEMEVRAEIKNQLTLLNKRGA